MAQYSETFQGCLIEIDDDNTLHIDGKRIDPVYDNGRGKWSSRYLPYTEYDSLIDLGQAIVRDTEEFTGDSQ
ncbi:MAG: hypothetical protein U9R74_04885 [Pseudomonadota bacterium]|nr:hypothetical protein [Pseudomonadota bacterium]